MLMKYLRRLMQIQMIEFRTSKTYQQMVRDISNALQDHLNSSDQIAKKILEIFRKNDSNPYNPDLSPVVQTQSALNNLANNSIPVHKLRRFLLTPKR